MPGNQQLYEQAMALGDGYAWDQVWDKAIAAYARAIQERPEDPRAHNSLGFALLQTKRYADALRVYTRARQLDPNDPLPLEKGADVLERLGKLKEAAEQYIAVADVYIAQQDLDKAIGNWERATLLTPGLLQIHFRLAQAYERTGKKRAAVIQYLIMAFNFQRSGDKNKALQAVERALRLEPNSPQVLNAKRAIESGELIVLPKTDEERRTGEVAGIQAEENLINPEGPLGEVTDKALAELAEAALSGDISPAVTHAIRGIESMKIAEYGPAVQAFQKAESMQMSHPSMMMCIAAGLLKQQKWDEAKRYLTRIERSETYGAGIQHGMGLVAIGHRNQREAADRLLRALELVDIGLAMNPEESDQIKTVWTALSQSTVGMQDRDLANRNDQFIKALTGKDWKIGIQDTRRALAEHMRSGDAKELIDLIGNKEIVESVGRIDRYLKNGLLKLAIEEAHYAIEKSPTSLPVHQRIAQVLMEEGKVQEAIVKYNLVAQSYLSRDDTASASGILYEVIKVAPTDVGLRTSLIELLERQEKWHEVLDEYIGLGQAYYELADMEQARATYNEANRLAQRLEAPLDKRVQVLKHIAEIDMSRLDLRQAQRTYEQIRQLVPNDEQPRRALVDIYYRLNNAIEATKELDGLLRLYAQSKRGDQIISLLESLIGSRPNDMGVRSRMAAVYRQIGRKQDAIAQLDALGELQLEAGLYQDACATIKQIVQLGPQDLEQYKTLLQQLGC